MEVSRILSPVSRWPSIYLRVSPPSLSRGAAYPEHYRTGRPVPYFALHRMGFVLPP